MLGTESGILNDSKTEQSSDAGEAKAFHEKSQSLSPSCKYKYITYLTQDRKKIQWQLI